MGLLKSKGVLILISKLVKTKIERACFNTLFFAVFYLISICFFIGNAMKNFPETTSLFYIVVIGVGTTFLYKILLLKVYVVVTLLINCIGIFVTSSTCIDKLTYLSYLICILIFTYLISYYRINKDMKKRIFEKTAFNEMMDAILILEEDTLKVIECNLKAIQLFHKEDRLIGRGIDELILSNIQKKIPYNHFKQYFKNRNKELAIMNEKLNNIWIDLHIKRFHVLENAYILVRIIDVSAHKKYEEKMKYLAYHDLLTELPNRRYGEERLKLAIHKALKKKSMLGVLFIDLDKFKVANDTLGHAAGDELLKKVAIRLQRSVRKNDIVVRLGGDEFMIILEDIELTDEIIAIANRMVNVFTQAFTIKGEEMYVTCSMGIAIFPQHGVDMETLMENADIAMYQAKICGRNNFKVFNNLLDYKALSCQNNSYRDPTSK
ncbi:GGDEF domain-containing protein [Crassaminicella indica]|uniref:GGDEF domain-containing protein n=1 Tax=Crassaminicella indica TaxID=2855394 RepID=A0ABX8RGU0_9CLOT|nr:GGDEF domain-containing protein [Crassaminicella indica]QXM07130.1 GGDEF domain-containing protein [Crassaminicella indica]